MIRDIWESTLSALGIVRRNPTIPALPDNMFDREVAAAEVAYQRRFFTGNRVVIATNKDSLR
jgi:hypothetical protein